MSALGHKRTSHNVWLMPAILPKADISWARRHVRFVPTPAYSRFERVASHRSGGHDVTGQPTNAARRWASTSTAVLGSAGNWRTVAS